MSAPPLFTRLDTVLLRVRDLGASRAWYEERLGFTAVFEDSAEGLVVYDTGGPTSLTLWAWKPGEEVAAGGAFPIFAVDDADAARAALRGRGIEAGEVEEGGGVRSFDFTDPDGNRIGVCQLLEG